MLALALAGCIVLPLAYVQTASMALYGDLAHAPAVPAFMPPSIGIRLGRPLGSRRMPAVVRGAYARALLHRGDRSAATIVAGLPDGADAADLRGQVPELEGDRSTALAAYARAGDFERAQRLIEESVNIGRYAQAAALEQMLCNALRGPGQAAVRARALWRLGQITQLEATTADAAAAPALQRSALDFYTQALAIAPNEETYLLAAGQQALTIGDRPAARRYYQRALEAVPNSADARAGLDRAGP